MSKIKVAIQGELGAYSHIAAERLYKDPDITTCSTFEETFKQAYNDPNYKIVIPIENSLAGRVADIHYLLPKYKLQIHGEYFLSVEHNLLGKLDAKIEDIKYVRSHAQAISQCQNIISNRKFKSIISVDTAGSAKKISELNNKEDAAIASSLAAKIYNLDVLEADFQDAQYNVTRFLIMSKDKIRIEPDESNILTTLVFVVRSIPASLYKCLGGFASNGVNITKLESYIHPQGFDVAQFYIDFEGHPESNSVKLALEEMKFFCKEIKILGVYKKSIFRKK